MKRVATLLAFVVATTAPVWARAETVADYIEKARQKEAEPDYRGAIAIYDAIIEQFPDEFPGVYAARGSDLAQEGEYKTAIADLDKALALYAADPKAPSLDRADALDERAKAKRESDDFAGAVADYTQLIALQPKDGDHYADRAEVKLSKGDCAGAIADYSSALQLVEKPSTLHYEGRANARICTGDLQGALEDYRANLPVEKELDGEAHISRLHRSDLNYWTVAVLLGRKAEGDGFLAAKLAVAPKPEGVEFEYDAARYFLDQADESPLARDAAEDKTSQPRYAELYDGDLLYFTALKQLALGDKAAARQSFEKILKFHHHYVGMEEHARAWIKVIDRKATKK